MKRLLAIVVLALLAGAPQAQKKSMFNYESAWKKVTETYQKKNLPETAIKEVDRILAAARKEGNDPQILKALLYKGRIPASNTEDWRVNEINALIRELPKTKGATRSLVHSMLANAYWEYLQENRWTLYDRTNTIDPVTDVQTMNAAQLHAEIQRHFLASLENPEALKKTPAIEYEAVLVKGNQLRLRPTLYDVVANAALSYFSTDDHSLTDHSATFEVDDPAAYAPAAEFARHRFQIADSSSLHARALTLQQDLIRFHLTDKDPEALIDADIARLRFIQEKSTLADKDLLYRAALAEIDKRYSSSPGSAQAVFLLAESSMREAMADKGPKANGERKDDLPRIKAQCQEAMKRHPGSEGALNCARIVQQLDRQTLSLQVEKVNLPSEPFRCMVGFKNIGNLHYRIIPFTDSVRQGWQTGENQKRWVYIKGRKALLQKSVKLPSTTDLRDHRVEIPMDGLPVGDYLMLASSDASFDLSKHPVSAVTFHVSRIGWINRGSDYFILDRSTGRPLSGAEIQVYAYEYDYGTRKSRRRALNELKSDADGYARIETNQQARVVSLKVGWQKDSLFLDEPDYGSLSQDRGPQWDAETYERINRKLFLFTDRSIYRPGQLVHFKGIMVTRDHGTRKPKLMEGFGTRIEFRNANGETVDSLDVKTGAYGSFSGSFRIPEKGLTGTFWMENAENNGKAVVQVEEYKRPSFVVEWLKPEGTLRVEEQVSVKGRTMAYAGNPLNDAKVRYRVRRTSRFPFPWLRYGYGRPQGRTMEVASGETRTGADGSFAVRFPAIPDRSIDPKTLPVFDFELTAEVTDLNGETRTATETVSIGYHSLDLSMDIREESLLSNAEDLQFPFTASNLAGVDQKIPVTFRLSPLQGPARLIRPRYWEAPDTHILDEPSYLRLFPYDEYGAEALRENWRQGTTTWESKESLKTRGQMIRLPLKGLTPGWYRIEATAEDGFGRPVTTRRDIRVRDAVSGKPDPNAYFTHSLSKPSGEPGEKVSLTIGSDADALWVIRHIDGHKGSVTPKTPAGKIDNPKKTVAWLDLGHDYRFIDLGNKAVQDLELPIDTEDRGGFAVGHAFVKHNRFFQTLDIVKVPWTDKELKVEFTSFRDRTEPGGKEQWTVRLKGSKGEQVAAEALLSMYDASLDQFLPHEWQRPDLFPTYPTRDDRYLLQRWSTPVGFEERSGLAEQPPLPEIPAIDKAYPRLLWEYGNMDIARPRMMADRAPGVKMMMKAESMPAMAMADSQAASNAYQALEEKVQAGIGNAQTKKKGEAANAVQVRKDFRETAFFLPDLKTDPQGDISFSFTIPEALTEWKWQVLAHTRDLAIGSAKQTVVTRKELMVQPNAPRFLREGDQLVLPARISNLTDGEVSGEAVLELFETETGKPVDGVFNNMAPRQFFTAAAGQGTDVGFRISVPGNYSGAVSYRIVAKTAAHSDGEEKALPVLSNRILVTESMPMMVKGLGTKSFDFEKLRKSGSSPTLTHHRLTFEYSSDPAWYAVQSLPYLTAFPYDCAEQLFNKFYANSVAGRIVESKPKIRDYYARWAKDSVQGVLNRNPELKDILLEETPWVMEAKDEQRQLRDIARLFDLVRLSQEQSATLDLLAKKQSSNGGFVWFSGGPDNRYITQYILTGMARLRQMDALKGGSAAKAEPMIRAALAYVRERLAEDHREALKSKAGRESIGELQVQGLYSLSAFGFEGKEKGYKEALSHYIGLTAKNWTTMGTQMQAMAAVTLHRAGDRKTASDIMRSLKETAVKSDDIGMYWKSNGSPWYWQSAPVETQAMAIEAFTLLAEDPAAVASMKQWLLTQKQTNRWSSTRSTADACHALLMRGGDWLGAERKAEIKAGVQEPMYFRGGVEAEAGTGYFKTVVDGPFVDADLGRIEVTVKGKGGADEGSLSWGAAHWQYFEMTDRITPASTPLSIVKRLFVERNTPKGPVLDPVGDGSGLKVGDKLKVRIELRSDRDMEFVHLKDMRASGSEPLNVLSGYRWQGGLGYYESTRDAATNFFFDRLPRGTHVFEYPLFATHEGRFSVGLATAECMYAPEFRAHSGGMELRVSR